MRIALLISSMAHPGGAERVLSAMANHWVSRGVAVTLITLDAAGPSFYPLDAQVKRVGLGLLADSAGFGQAVINNSRRVRAIRLAILADNPDVLISFIDITNVLALIGTSGLGIPVIVSERVHPSAHPTGRAWSLLRRHFYPRAAGVVVQTQGTRAWAERFIRSDRIHVVPNPVAAETTGAVADRQVRSGRTLLAMGRLTHQKGFDLLIDAFARCKEAGAADRLIIVGEGPERANLSRLIAERGLHGRVHLAGNSDRPQELLQQADIFVLSSRYEGFPNVLLESMAAGLPVISFDCPHGPGEIIRHEIDGLLVPVGDADALSAAIDRMLSDADLRERCGAQARDVTSRFSMDHVMQEWGKVVAAATSGSRLN